MLLDESSFDVTAAPGVKVPQGYTDYFKSIDGKQRTMVAEATGGPTWYTEFNVLTGMSARSFGDLKFYVTRIAAGRVTRGLPQALQRCGYKTVSLYPTYGDFLGARTFQKGAGVEQFIDMAEMGVDEDMQPDKFYFDQALKVFAGQQPSQSPVFMFVYLTANHFPWTSVYRPDLTPDWTPPGNTAEIDEYIRRQTMTAKDYGDFTARLARDYPDQSFLVLRFGDHQPAISQKMLEPGIDQKSLAQRLMAADPRYFSTYYALDGINFSPPDLSSALETLDAAYLPLVIQEAAGVPLDPSFEEQKRIMLRCNGRVLCLQERRGSPPLQPPPDRRRHDQGALDHCSTHSRHCESEGEAIHASACCEMDCFASLGNDGEATLLLPHLLPQPLRHRVRRARRVVACRAQIGLAHRGDVDPAEQRLQRGAQRLVVGALRREQHHRVIGRDRAPGIAEHHEIVFRDQPVAGVARDDVDFAGRRPPHT